MLFGRRDKNKSNDRVQELKARVDALRQADEASRKKAYSLDHFLEGDDVLTGRDVEDNYKPTGFSTAEAPASDYETHLAAELEKYLRREEARALADETPAEPKVREREPEAQEGGSLLLDGTWSRDADRRNTLTAADRAWNVAGAGPASRPEDVTPGSETGSAASEAPASGAFGLDQWPAEEDWPPREEAV